MESFKGVEAGDIVMNTETNQCGMVVHKGKLGNMIGVTDIGSMDGRMAWLFVDPGLVDMVSKAVERICPNPDLVGEFVVVGSDYVWIKRVYWLDKYYHVIFRVGRRSEHALEGLGVSWRNYPYWWDGYMTHDAKIMPDEPYVKNDDESVLDWDTYQPPTRDADNTASADIGEGA